VAIRQWSVEKNNRYDLNLTSKESFKQQVLVLKNLIVALP
jgi:hypothetical protein